MHYILTGFTQELGYRVFEFEKISPDHERTAFTVRADLALTRKYAIRMQELPLLCRLLLERSDAADETRAFTFTEEDMSQHAKSCAAARPAHSSFKRKFSAEDPSGTPLVEH